MGTSSDDAGRIAELEQQMREVIRRLGTLEQAAGHFPRVQRGPGAVPGSDAGHGHVEPLLRPAGQEEWEGGQGQEATLGYWGAGKFGPQRVMIRKRATLSEVLATEPEAITPVFAALASPVRILLLRALIGGPRTSQQLREVLAGPSVGQLYHHLRELLVAGLVVQPSRSLYEIPPGKVVAVCVAVSAAAHLTTTSHQLPPPPEPEPPEPEPPEPEPPEPEEDEPAGR
jgi:DNA-binding transcriptional ArsR family regulator